MSSYGKTKKTRICWEKGNCPEQWKWWCHYAYIGKCSAQTVKIFVGWQKAIVWIPQHCLHLRQTLKWGRCLEERFCNPPFQTSNSCMQKMPLQCRLQSFYTEKLLLFLWKIGIFGIWPHSGELPEVGADSDRDRGNVIKLVIFVIIRPCSVTVRHPSPLY